MVNNNRGSLTQRAAEIGKFASENEIGLRKTGGSHFSDDLHHLGDDTGRLIVEAFKSGGVTRAADVVDAYLKEYNEVRAAHGLPSLSAKNAIKNVQWACAPSSLSNTDLDSLRNEFNRRHP